MFKTYRVIAKEVRKRVPEVFWIDRDKGQLKDPANFHSILVPGLLLHFGGVQWTGLSRGDQQGMCTMRASLVFNLPPSTYTALEDPLSGYHDSEILSMRLHDALKQLPIVGERRASLDYFTSDYYVCSMDYDCEVMDTRELQIIQKPAPTIESTIHLPYNT